MRTETIDVVSSREAIVTGMRRGDVIDNRFEIIEFAGGGGMGTVYRALDRMSHAAAALKVLRNPSGSDVMRFAHETRVLAGLHHPHIVQHVADGIAPDGEPYLAMEWLEGESLTARLSRKGLQLDESIELARRVASALGAAHAKGIVHRDIKPSNIFLAGGVEGVKVLDFGIARRVEATMALTRTGSMLGTPGYMAPEQARGERHVLDARADVFSLGCVLFECLTGRPAFLGIHVMALLAKLIMEEVPRVRALRPEIPEALDALVGRMLAKNPADRPVDGAAVVKALDGLGALDGRAATQPPRADEVITGTETRLVSVVVLVPNAAGGPIEPTSSGVFGNVPRKLLGEVRRAVEPFGANVEELACGVLVAMIVGAGNPTDQAALGARAALCMRELVPDAALVLLAGRGSDTGSLPVGDVLERAAALVSAAAAQGGEPSEHQPIRLDEVTRALLDVRFDVAEHAGQVLLRREREVGTDARTLLGRPSPFVGRDRELRALVDLVEESFEENRACAVLLTGPAGMGKSRLCYEFLRNIRERHPELAIAVGRGDSVSAGSAFGVLATTFRNSLGIAAGEPIEAQREKLSGSVRSFVPEPDRQRVMEFLGEMIGTPFPDDSSPKLRAAHQDASIMADQLQAAYIDFTTAVVATRPVLLVLEDLHWGDAPSVKLIDSALRQLKHKPFVVVAFARPEVHDRFPKLWEERDIQEIRIRELSRRAAENLVKSMLGAKAEDKLVATLVDRAAGNAFYLEELIRAVAEGRGNALPETIVGMVEARLAVLDAEARRLLRAASIFGETFWKRGVRLLLGEEASMGGKDRLAELVEQEVLVRHPESRLAGEEEYAFRHALLREGAYAMLTEGDRVLGHKLAGEWLERAGEKNPKLLAAHFDLGGDGARAALHYARAAEQALEGGDCEGAIKLAERGIACGPEAERIAELRAVEADGRGRNGDLEGSARAAAEALRLARPGSRSECRALGSMIGAALYLRNIFMLKEPMERLLVTNPDPDAIALLMGPFAAVITALAFMAQRGLMELYLRRLEQVTASVVDQDSIAAAQVEFARSFWACHGERDCWGWLDHARCSVLHYDRSGATGLLPNSRQWLACAHAALGLFDQAEEQYSRILSTASGAGLRLNAELARSAMLVDQRKLDEAAGVAAWVIQQATEQGDLLQARIGRLNLVEAHLYKGAIDVAESEALALGEDTGAEPYFGMWYLAVLAAIRLAQGRAQDAAETAERAFAQSQACGMGFPYRHAMLLLVRAEALHALGDHTAASNAIREARDDLLRRADKIPDAEVRRSFLENLPDHRRTLELARQWLGQDGDATPGSGAEQPIDP